MKSPGTKGARFAKSFKGLGARFSFAFFMLLGAVVLIASRADPSLFDHSRSVAEDTAAPALNVLRFPAKITANVVSWTENIIFLHRENARLTEDNNRLKAWHVAAERLTAENERLRGLLGLKTITAAPVASANVVGQSSSNFVRSVIIDAGKTEGIDHNNTVLDQTGLVGRIISVGKSTSRVLLLTDLNSRVPVKVLPSEVNAILAGDNSGTPSLIFIPGGVTFNVGDWIVTTGHGGVFPPDVPIGRISALPQGAPPRVALTTDYSRLDTVRIYKYTPPPAPVAAEVLDSGPAAPAAQPKPATPAAAPTTAPAPATQPAAPEPDEEDATPPPESVPNRGFE
ncbi:rod shape-determining protein MreC [Govanella unica]|uniref:Cell shape-determining protein MreC n=1 Tax=Govanella unica TaxID=2975056 RepID=A0A9X3TXG8_9PROT|nr:rod shape-determining protein MreC [Govania unica]MDA5193480.1 rod shape-determining protein MreC [Govania unica]